jgi:hypothetical protein
MYMLRTLSFSVQSQHEASTDNLHQQVENNLGRARRWTKFVRDITYDLKDSSLLKRGVCSIVEAGSQRLARQRVLRSQLPHDSVQARNGEWMNK